MEKDSQSKEEKFQLNRRSFLGVGALTAAGVAAASLTACGGTSGDAGAAASGEEAAPVSLDLSGATELDYDVVVVGSGSSGTTCALTVAQAGGKVLLLEKDPLMGGLSNFSVMVAATETELQKEKGFDIQTDFVVDYILRRGGYSNNGPMVRKVIEKSGSTIPWLIENGVFFILAPGYLQGALEDWQCFNAHFMVDVTYESEDPDFPSEGRLRGVHATFVDKYGGEIMVETSAVQVLTDDAGAVVGLAAEAADGTLYKINAKAVVLAAGSYTGYTDYLRDVINTKQVVQRAPKVNNGDGFRLAEEVGGTVWDETPAYHQTAIVEFEGDESEPHEISLLTDEVQFSLFHRTPLVAWINREGERFANEEAVGSFVNWGTAPSAHGGVYFELFDQAQVDDFVANGTPTEFTCTIASPSDYFGSGMDASDEGVTPIDRVGKKSGPAPELQAALDAAVDAGTIYKADSIEELAAAIGALPETLQATVDTYNGFVEGKKDGEYFKDSKYLVYPISTAPYYLIRAQSNIEGGLLGGTYVNSNFQLMSYETGHPIPNIYATGQNAGGMHGWNTYAEWGGLTMCYALNSGRLAGDHIVNNYLN